MNTRKNWLVLVVSLVCWAQTAVAKDLILTSPPRETPEAGLQQYGPLADHLSKLLNKKVVYEHPSNWLSYQRDMREDKYDIVFDGPQFISWRMAHLDHEVLVKLTGILQFLMVAEVNDAEVNKPEDLVGKKICSISPPNLSILSILAAFPNPVQQPVVKGIGGEGMGGVLSTFGTTDCRAWVYRNTFYKGKMTDQDRAKVKVIFNSKQLPNQGISVSKRLSDRDKSLMIQSLTLGDGVKATQPTVKRFGDKDAKAFVPARAEEYVGHNLLLEGVIFGWE